MSTNSYDPTKTKAPKQNRADHDLHESAAILQFAESFWNRAPQVEICIAGTYPNAPMSPGVAVIGA